VGTYLVMVPDLSDDELIYDETETRQILSFFYPGSANQITAIQVDNEARRLAQTMLIAAVDGSYAMGFVDDLFATLTSVIKRPNRSLKALGAKLARKFVTRWFKHATQSDLQDFKIYETVRVDVARTLRTRFDLLLLGQSANLRPSRGVTLHLVAQRQEHMMWG
jgi:hypothetical protein